jgi:hypothetical protein
MTNFGKAVAVAMSHPIGVGNARHRYPTYEGYVEGAQFPTIRRWVFDRIGTFDERLVRNQDDEFNFRIRKAGGLIYVSPRVRYTYFVRESASSLFRQYFQYGFWRIPVMEKHRGPTTLRQLAPTLFYATCLLIVVGSWYAGRAYVGAVAPAVYATILLLVGVDTARSTNVRIALWVPLSIAIIHAGYAFGVAYGLWARLFRSAAWDRRGRMATLSR